MLYLHIKYQAYIANSQISAVVFPHGDTTTDGGKVTQQQIGKYDATEPKSEHTITGKFLSALHSFGVTTFT